MTVIVNFKLTPETKIPAIKFVRIVGGHGLKEAKDIVDEMCARFKGRMDYNAHFMALAPDDIGQAWHEQVTSFNPDGKPVPFHVLTDPFDVDTHAVPDAAFNFHLMTVQQAQSHAQLDTTLRSQSFLPFRVKRIEETLTADELIKRWNDNQKEIDIIESMLQELQGLKDAQADIEHRLAEKGLQVLKK